MYENDATALLRHQAGTPQDWFTSIFYKQNVSPGGEMLNAVNVGTLAINEQINIIDAIYYIANKIDRSFCTRKTVVGNIFTYYEFTILNMLVGSDSKVMSISGNIWYLSLDSTHLQFIARLPETLQVLIVSNNALTNVFFVLQCRNVKALIASGCSLTQVQIDYILAGFVAFNNGVMFLELNNNSAPSPQGLLDVATLVSRGCSVKTD